MTVTVLELMPELVRGKHLRFFLSRLIVLYDCFRSLNILVKANRKTGGYYIIFKINLRYLRSYAKVIVGTVLRCPHDAQHY